MVRVASSLIFNKLVEAKFPVVAIRDVAENVQYGYTEKAAKEEIGPKYVRITDLQDGQIKWETVPYCKCEQPEQYLLSENDLLFARTGATTGKTHLVRENPPSAVFASYLIRVRPQKSINPEYLYSFFQSDLYWSQVSDKKEGSAQPNVNGQKLSNIQIPILDKQLQTAINEFLAVVRLRQDGFDKELPELPSPLTEQRRIVARIEALAARVAAAQSLRRQADDLTRLYEASIAKSVFKLQLENNGTSSDNLPELPNKRRWARIGDFAFVTKLAGFEFTKHVEYSEFGEVPVIRAQNISKTGFKDGNYLYVKKDLVELLQRSRLQGGEILMVFVGAGIGNVGIAPKNKEFFLGPNVALIRIDENIVDNRYLYEFLKSAIGKSRSRGFSKVTAQGSISMSNIRDIQVPLPTLDEQRRIAAYLDGLQARVSALRAVQAETERELSALMPSVLDRAFKGEL